GVARGLLSERQVREVNRRVEELVGPIATWAVCPHGPDDGCGCRKPRPGLVLGAAASLGVPASRCAVVGDIGADVDAARLAGLRADAAVVLTSFHQSPLPLALLLRMAGVRRIGAISADYPGSLLDVRHQVDDDRHEVERSLSLAAAMGFRLPPGDEGGLG